MWLLALETTSAHGSLALLEDGALRAARDLEAGRYSTQLFTALSELAAAAGLSLSQVEAYAVANGPGSFTGVRVGLTAVKGLIEVWHRPAIAVSTLAAVAALAETDAPVLAALDAARGEVYWGHYSRRRVEEGLESCERFGARVRASGLLVATPHEALRSALQECIGADQAGRITLVSRRLAPAVGRIGWERLAREGSADALRLDANYIRRSDAEIFHRG